MSSETPVTCLHCGRWIERDFKGMGWWHVRTGRVECDPVYAAPVFPDDPTYHPPDDLEVSR